jgi:ectoine hydroxylase-related dioxygenase (phytanoyl-CoA dioxygenase family)
MSKIMRSIPVSASELASGELSSEKLQLAISALEKDGIVVIEDIVDLGHIKALREKVMEDVDKFVNNPNATFNWNRGNVQQDPPPFPPYLFRDVLANDIVIQVTSSILGSNMYNGFYSGNTAMPSESRQPVHADLGQLWPNQQEAHPAYGLVVNVGLVDMSPENGSTEIWPGTHKDTSVVYQDGDIEVSAARLAERRATEPPFQPTVRPGGVVIRDIRLWHAGMPNRTQTPRPMLAMIHYTNWWHSPPFAMHSSGEELLKHPKLRQNAVYTDGVIDYVRTK